MRCAASLRVSSVPVCPLRCLSLRCLSLLLTSPQDTVAVAPPVAGRFGAGTAELHTGRRAGAASVLVEVEWAGDVAAGIPTMDFLRLTCSSPSTSSEGGCWCWRSCVCVVPCAVYVACARSGVALRVCACVCVRARVVYRSRPGGCTC